MSNKVSNLNTKSRKNKSKTKQVKNNKEKLELREELEMSSDEENDSILTILPELHDIFANPTKLVPQGEVFITMINALSKKFDNERDALFSTLNPNLSLDLFQKEINIKKKKENKKRIKKEGKFIPLDEKGIQFVSKRNKSPKSLYRPICHSNTTEEDLKNEEYYKNDKYDKGVYFEKKWKSLSKKELKKYQTISLKYTELYDNAYEKQKPEERPKGPKNSFFIFKEDKEILEKYKKELSGLKHTEKARILGQKWRSIKEDVEKNPKSSLSKIFNRINEETLKSKEECKLKLVEYEKKQIELKKNEEKKQNSLSVTNNNEQDSDNEQDVPVTEDVIEDDSDSDSDSD